MKRVSGWSQTQHLRDASLTGVCHTPGRLCLQCGSTYEVHSPPFCPTANDSGAGITQSVAQHRRHALRVVAGRYAGYLDEIAN